jgi:hypothetical protein
LGKVKGGIAAPVRTRQDRVDQLIADLARPRHEAVDGRRGECRQQRTSGVRVTRGIVGYRRRAAAARRHEITHDHLTRGKIFAIEGDGPHVLIPRRQVDTPIAVRVGNRALLP